MDVHCGEIKRGEIYWVDFGKTKGSEQGGKRPALVVQNNIFLRENIFWNES